MARAPWHRSRDVAALAAGWRADPSTRDEVVAWRELPPRDPRAVPFPHDLAPALARALRSRGIDALYAHQAEAFALARGGRHLVVATPTASGKSLCFHLPVAQRLIEDPEARALYLLPTKALARDQEHSLRALLRAAELPAAVSVVDGDTPTTDRRAAREGARVVITNPDMLHAALLPHHTSWARLLGSLRYVVVDELHACAGVFGGHVANVLRRLLRAARFHGASPTVLAASATIANPAEHAARLIGMEVTAVTGSGAPQGPRHVMVCNPPVVNAELNLRASHTRTAVRYAADLVRNRVPTILFGSTRRSVETMLRYLRDRLVPEGVPEESLQAYRGGYLADTRRRIEQGLRDGDVRCVVATSALELGIDVGDLDAVVCAGWPGSLAALWQRFGRAGRRNAASLGVLVASNAPVDQYLARDPSWLFGASVEEARIDPHNVELLLQHARCAAFELPFARGEPFGDLASSAVGDLMDVLVSDGELHASRDRWHWVGGSYPAEAVSLRAVGSDNVVIVDATRDVALAEVDRRDATLVVHPRAIYQHEGAAWYVERVDLDAGKAWVVPSPQDWFTEPSVQTDVGVLERRETAPLADAEVALGEIEVVTRVTGFRKVRFHAHEHLGHEKLDLPPSTMQTTACWIAFPEDALDALAFPDGDRDAGPGRPRVHEGLRGMASAWRAVASLALMCDPRDLRASLDVYAVDDSGDEPRRSPALYLYDAVPGGVGLASEAFRRRDELLGHALRLIASCPCSDGCPACVSPGAESGPWSRKQMALSLLTLLGAQ